MTSNCLFDDLFCFVFVLQKTIDYLKFDIELSEWTALKTMILDGSISHVKQLGFELHAHKANSTLMYYTYWNVVTSLEMAGFQIWNSFFNIFIRCHHSKLSKQVCNLLNMHYINIRYLWPTPDAKKNIQERLLIVCLMSTTGDVCLSEKYIWSL